LLELHGLAAQVFELWSCWLQLLRARPTVISYVLRRRWEVRQRERWGESVFSEILMPAEPPPSHAAEAEGRGPRGEAAAGGAPKRAQTLTTAHRPSHHHRFRKHTAPPPSSLQLATQLRRSRHYGELPPLRLADVHGDGGPVHSHPILLEVQRPPIGGKSRQGARAAERAQGTQPQQQQQPFWTRANPSARSAAAAAFPAAAPAVDLVVMVHGWFGSSHDMRTLRNYMTTLLPDAGSGVQRHFLLATSNEQQSGVAPFATMGANLAAEVIAFLKAERVGLETLRRVSFVAFSLGGVCVRAALSQPSLQPLLPK
jgi:hypothetical protein